MFKKKIINVKMKKNERLVNKNRSHIIIKKKLQIKNDLLVKKFKKALFEKNKVKKALLLKKKLLKRITIKFKQNNIFCTLINLINNKTLHVGSSGIYKLKISKRKLKYVFLEVLNIFFNKMRKHIKNYNNTIFNIVVPKYTRKAVFKLIYTNLIEAKTVNKPSILKEKKIF